MATNGQFNWPSTGTPMATYGQFSMAADIGLDRALQQGIRDLRRSGFEVRLPTAEDEHPQGSVEEQVYLASGRIVQEAIHNATKHGLRPGPVVVAVERTEQSLDILVSNPIPVGPEHHAEGMGLGVIRQHAEVVGGSASFSHVEGTWTCAASLPVQVAEGHG